MPVSMSNGSAERPGPLPDRRSQNRASDRPGKGASRAQPEQVDDRGRDVAQAHRLGDHPTRRHRPSGSTITSGTWTS